MSGVNINVSDMTEICHGVLKKNDKTYYIQCCVNETWHYCIAARFEKLVKKYGSAEQLGKTYKSREAKQEERPLVIKKDRKCSIPRANLEQFEESERTYNYLPKPPTDFSFMHKNRSNTGYRLWSKEGTLCIRPGILNKTGYCNGCPWWHDCKLEEKSWKRTREQINRDVRHIPKAMYNLHTEQESIESRSTNRK